MASVCNLSASSKLFPHRTGEEQSLTMAFISRMKQLLLMSKQREELTLYTENGSILGISTVYGKSWQTPTHRQNTLCYPFL